MTTPREIIAEATRKRSDQAEKDAREEYQRFVDRVNRATDAEIEAAIRAMQGGKP